MCCFPRPPTSAHPAGINYTQTPPLPSTKTKKHSLFKAHWMIYTCASPVGVDLRDGRPALEDRGLSFSSAAILLMDAGDARPFLSPSTFVSTGDCPWNADVLMAQQREPRSAPSSCSSVAGFTKCVPVPHDPNGRSVFFSESRTRIWVTIMRPRRANTSWKENRRLFKCILRFSHHLSLCSLAVFGCSETQNVSFSCQ